MGAEDTEKVTRQLDETFIFDRESWRIFVNSLREGVEEADPDGAITVTVEWEEESHAE